MRIPATSAIFSAMVGVVTDIVARSVEALDDNAPTAVRVESLGALSLHELPPLEQPLLGG